MRLRRETEFAEGGADRQGLEGGDLLVGRSQVHEHPGLARLAGALAGIAECVSEPLCITHAPGDAHPHYICRGGV